MFFFYETCNNFSTLTASSSTDSFVSSLLQLLSNVVLWDGIVQEDKVRDLGLSKLLNRYLLLNILNTPLGLDNIEKCNKVKDNAHWKRIHAKSFLFFVVRGQN